MEITSTVAEEIPYLSSWDACARWDEGGQPQTWLRNGTDAVWVLDGVSWSAVAEHTLKPDPFGAGPAKEASLAAIVADAAFLSPGATVLVNRSPADVGWSLDMMLTAAWEGQGAVLETAEERLGSLAVSQLVGDGAGRRALRVCAMGVYNEARSVEEWDASTPSTVILNGLGVGMTTAGCYTETRGVPVQRPNGQWSTLGDEFMPALPEHGVLRQVDARLGPFTGTVKLLGLKLVTRGRGG